MSEELVHALIVLVRYCSAMDNCATCKLRNYCGKTIQSF